MGNGDEVEELGTLVVPFIKELQPALRVLWAEFEASLHENGQLGQFVGS